MFRNLKRIPQAMELPLFLKLKTETMTHPMVAESTLSTGFRTTRGFALLFTDRGIPQLLSRFPFFAPYLELIGAGDKPGKLLPWSRRLFSGKMRKAYYLNLLMVPDSAEVGRHVDATLRRPLGVEGLLPLRVSVLWLCVPPGMDGGVLNLHRGDRTIAHVQPEERLLIHFRGDLAHSVTAVRLPRKARDQQRASLVCEQYLVPESALTDFPPFSLHSTADFSAHLLQAEGWLESGKD